MFKLIDDCISFNSSKMLYKPKRTINKSGKTIKKYVNDKNDHLFNDNDSYKMCFNIHHSSKTMKPKQKKTKINSHSPNLEEETTSSTSLSGDDLDKVNVARMRGVRKYYRGEKSAIAKIGITKKAPYDGYWTYESMVLQLEDTLNYPAYDLLFLFDHSNAHDRLQPDGLNINKVNKYYGGKQAMMRDSVLDTAECFGPYHDENYNLQIGSTQRMVYTELDPGPFYMDMNK
jgi:hypothetical protein